jgi:hypothetical protein
MTPAWALRQEDLLHDCIVSPDIFNPMVDRLRDFVVPYQQAMETETAQRNMHLYLQGLLSHLPSKNAEDIATFVQVERRSCIGILRIIPLAYKPGKMVPYHHHVRGSCHDTTPGLLSTGDSGPALVVRDAPLPLAQPRPGVFSQASRTDPHQGQAQAI